MKCLKISIFSLLMTAIWMIGCSKPDAPKPKSDAGSSTTSSAAAPEAKEHSHGAGPNGGVVFDLGSHHAEFTVDHGKQEAIVLILGADGKTLTPIDAKELLLNIKETKSADGKVVQPMTVTMMPVDVADGKASKFVGGDPGIGNVADFAGTVSGEIDGKPAMGEFAE